MTGVLVPELAEGGKKTTGSPPPISLRLLRKDMGGGERMAI